MCRKSGERGELSEGARCSDRRAVKLTSVTARKAERASLKFLDAGLSREKRTGLRSGSRDELAACAIARVAGNALAATLVSERRENSLKHAAREAEG